MCHDEVQEPRGSVAEDFNEKLFFNIVSHNIGSYLKMLYLNVNTLLEIKIQVQ